MNLPPSKRQHVSQLTPPARTSKDYTAPFQGSLDIMVTMMKKRFRGSGSSEATLDADDFFNHFIIYKASTLKGRFHAEFQKKTFALLASLAEEQVQYEHAQQRQREEERGRASTSYSMGPPTHWPPRPPQHFYPSHSYQLPVYHEMRTPPEQQYQFTQFTSQQPAASATYPAEITQTLQQAASTKPSSTPKKKAPTTATQSARYSSH